MSKLTLTETSPSYFTITGSLTFASINKQAINAFKSRENTNITIDLAKVTATDSAGLALMIEWIRLSQLQQFRILFKNIPEQLLALAKLTGLDKNQHFVSHSE